MCTANEAHIFQYGTQYPMENIEAATCSGTLQHVLGNWEYSTNMKDIQGEFYITIH